MAPGYGHSRDGVNVANSRLLTDKGAYISTFHWQLESERHVGLGQTQNQMSTSLRHTASAIKAAAAEQVASDIQTVEAALRGKLKHTEMLRNALSVTIMDTVAEIEQCALLKASLQQRIAKIADKAELNQSRLQARSRRPLRERTMDDVEAVLLQQQGLVGTSAERVQRAIGHLDREMQQLDMVRVKLEADVRDKIEALDVDTKVLAVQADGSPGEAATLRRRSEMATRTPTSWVSSTEENIKASRRWIADSVRLRKAIRHAVLGARSAEHELARTLNSHMLGKIAETKGLRQQLQQQLLRVQEERASAQAQRASLTQALESKRGPLQQAKERLQARKARPDREQVQDDVESALVAEIAHLNAITLQLHNKLTAVDRTISHLEVAAATLEDNIRDKDTTLTMEEQVVMLDGRLNMQMAPPSSVGSYSMGSVANSEVRDATMRRINELELELQVARKERQALEVNVASLRTSLGSPRGALTP